MIEANHDVVEFVLATPSAGAKNLMQLRQHLLTPPLLRQVFPLGSTGTAAATVTNSAHNPNHCGGGRHLANTLPCDDFNATHSEEAGLRWCLGGRGGGADASTGQQTRR